MENIRKIVPDEEVNKVDLKGYWKVIWRKKYYLIIPVLLSLVISVTGTRYLTPVYQSSTILSMEREGMFSGSVDRYVADGEDRQRSRTRQFATIINAKLRSNSFLGLVVEDLGLMNDDNSRKLIRDYDQEEASGISPRKILKRYLIGVLRNKITISSPAPGLYEVSVFDTDPDNCYILSRRISEKYLDVLQQQKLTSIRKAGAFSDEQLAIYREKLEISEKELARIQRDMLNANSHGNPVNPGNLSLTEVKKNHLDAECETNKIALNRIRNKLVSIFDMVPSSKKVLEDEVVINLENKLNTRGSEIILMEIAGEMDISSRLDEIELSWRTLQKRISTIIQKEYSDISFDYYPVMTEYFYQLCRLTYFKSMRNNVQSYIEQYKNKLSRLPVLEMELERLRREVENNTTIQQAFLESKASAQISEAIQSTNLGLNLNIIEKAQRPISPVRPNKLQIILMSLIFGGACGLGAILITEYMNDSFRSVEEVQRIMELPVICTIPRTIEHFSWEKKDWGRKILIWIIGVFFFISIISGAIYFYANTLKSSGLGIKISEELKR